MLYRRVVITGLAVLIDRESVLIFNNRGKSPGIFAIFVESYHTFKKWKMTSPK